VAAAILQGQYGTPRPGGGRLACATRQAAQQAVERAPLCTLRRFKNLDKLIHHVNQDGRVRAFYSTPSQYTKAKHSYRAEWPVKRDDFFPYADTPHSYWTGAS
jgi:hypothetical protein